MLATVRRAMNVYEAATSGTRRDLLEAIRDRLAEAVADKECPKRDLASLTRRLIDVDKEIDALKSQEGEDDLGEAASTPDEPFDPEAL